MPRTVSVLAGSRIWRPLLFTLFMLVVGNAKSVWGTHSLAGDPMGVLLGVLVAVVCLLYACCSRLGAAELGLTGWRAGAISVAVGLGLVVGPMLVIAALAAIAVPLPKPAPPGDLAELTNGALVRRLSLYLPFDTVLPEELLFRAVLLAELRRRYRSWIPPMVLLTLAFVIWHAALGLREVPDLAPDQLALKFGAYLLGSLFFTVPRLWPGPGHLLGCMVAHWLADAVLMLIAHPLGCGLREVILPPCAAGAVPG